MKSVIFLGVTAATVYLIYRKFFAEDQISSVADTAPATTTILPDQKNVLPTSLKPGFTQPEGTFSSPVTQAEDVNQMIELNAIIPEVEAQAPKLPQLVNEGLPVQTAQGTKLIQWDCPKINAMKRTYHRLSQKDKKPATKQRARLAAEFLHKVEQVKC